MNSPEARTSTGELIDQSAAPKPETPATPGEGAPETYADFTVPEGSTVSKEVIGESATPLFRELGLSQDQAQKLVDFYSTQVGKINAENKFIVTGKQIGRAHV